MTMKAVEPKKKPPQKKAIPTPPISSPPSLPFTPGFQLNRRKFLLSRSILSYPFVSPSFSFVFSLPLFLFLYSDSSTCKRAREMEN